MIKIDPPQVKPYAPETRPIAYVDVLVQREESSNRIMLVLSCLDARRAKIQIDQENTPQPAITHDQYTAFLAGATQAGDTFDQQTHRRALPIVHTNLGLTGTVE